jgi:hypothetical protein
MQLKQVIIEHCRLWKDKLAQLLLQLTYDKIMDSYRYTKENTEKYEILCIMLCIEWEGLSFVHNLCLSYQFPVMNI